MTSLDKSHTTEEKGDLALRLHHCKCLVQDAYAAVPFDQPEALDGLIQAVVELEDLLEELNP